MFHTPKELTGDSTPVAMLFNVFGGFSQVVWPLARTSEWRVEGFNLDQDRLDKIVVMGDGADGYTMSIPGALLCRLDPFGPRIGLVYAVKALGEYLEQDVALTYRDGLSRMARFDPVAKPTAEIVEFPVLSIAA